MNCPDCGRPYNEPSSECGGLHTKEFDGAQAEREGWGIFDCDGSENGPWQLQKIDERNVFETDLSAWQYVVNMALAGSAYHRSAIDYLREHSPAEFASFCKFTNYKEQRA